MPLALRAGVRSPSRCFLGNPATCLGRIVAALALVACTRAPQEGVVNTARKQFSQGWYCPLDRVRGVGIYPVATPPAAIAADAERLAMWREAARRASENDERKTIDVAGCGERAFYACWEWVGRAAGERRGPLGSYGWSCNEENPQLPPR